MKLTSQTVAALEKCSKDLSSILRQNSIKASKEVLLNDLLLVVAHRAEGKEITAAVAPKNPAPVTSYNVAADIISLAYASFHDGDIEKSMRYFASACDAEGIDELVQAMVSMNHDIEEASYRKDRSREAERTRMNGNKDMTDVDTKELINQADMNRRSSGVPVDQSPTDAIDEDHLDDLDPDENEDDDDNPAFSVDSDEDEDGEDNFEAYASTEADDDNDLDGDGTFSGEADDDDNPTSDAALEDDFDPDEDEKDGGEDDDYELLDLEDTDDADDDNEGFEDESDNAEVKSVDKKTLLANMISITGTASKQKNRII